MTRLHLSIRIDDVFNRGHPARPRSLTPVMDLVESYGYRLTLNVIPRRLIESPNQDGQMVRELQGAVARGHEIIQHGYDHCCSQCGDTSHQTFCPLLNREQPIEAQLRDIQRGKEMLEAAIGQRVVVYGPTGSDPHTTQLLTVVKHLGFVAITGEHTEDNIKLKLPNIPSGDDYAFGAKTQAEFDLALTSLKAEFNQVLKSAPSSDTPAYFQILLHDPGIRSGYENGGTLDYLRRMLSCIKQVDTIDIKNVLCRDILKLTDADLQLPEPTYPTLFREIAGLKGLP